MKKLETIIENARKKIRKKKWKCMSPSCNSNSIKSHVLQKNGILNQISKDRHLIQPFVPSLFRFDNKNVIELGKVGLNKVFTFPGFCNKHDTEIFKPIESKSIEFKSKKVQLLFSYRALCQEIWRKIKFLEMVKLIEPQINPIISDHIETFKFGNKSGVRNLRFFKKEIERELAQPKEQLFKFYTLEIPKIDICISIPLNIGHKEIIKENLEKYGTKDLSNWKIVNTSFLNVFPFHDKLVIIAGYHKKYPCPWIKELIERLSINNLEAIKKILSELITFKLDYWCMSPSLWENIGIENQNKFKLLYSENFYNTSTKIKTEFNLFKEIKKA